jgi:hypothetical protein
MIRGIPESKGGIVMSKKYLIYSISIAGVLIMGLLLGVGKTQGYYSENPLTIFSDNVVRTEVKNLDSAFVIGGFDLLRGGDGGSIQYGSYFDQGRISIGVNFPDVSYASFSSLTAGSLSGVDILLLSSVKSNNTAITPLNTSEQNVLFDYVKGGGCAILMTDNNSFGGSDSDIANESLIDSFGMDVDGVYSGEAIATVSNPDNSLITNGPFGLISSFSQYFPGGITNLGPYAIELAINPIGGGLGVINANKIQEGSGSVVFYSDSNTFFDDQGFFFENESLFLNTISYCLPSRTHLIYLPLCTR